MARIKIADMEEGSTYECPLVVTSTSARKTKAGKDYLVMELYDGFDKITCNYWDWNGEKTPQKNVVYDFRVECSTYMGKKQLICKHVLLNTTDPVEDFMPQGKYDIALAYKNIYELAATVLTDDFYRSLTISILEDAKGYWLHVPGAKSIHHAWMGGTLVHSLSVAHIALAIAENVPGAWIDLTLCGAILHDLGKLFTYKLEGVSIDYTDEGVLLDHVYMSANFVDNFAAEHIKDEMDELKLLLLKHVLLSHHGNKEWGSPVTPKCMEAWLVHYADMIDAACEAIREASAKMGDVRFTEKIWQLGNTEHFTVQAMEKLQTKIHCVSWADYIEAATGESLPQQD